MEIKIDEKTINFEHLEIQEHNNLTIIPLKSNDSNKTDILSLKKGLDMGLVIVKECEPESVGEVMVTNNAITPLLLMDGEEIIGAKQNRIINKSTIIPPKTTMKISVSCTEKGRWEYKNDFKEEFSCSEYIANSNTRRAKANTNEVRHHQNVVWNSIDELECQRDYHSKTSAMNDNYKNLNYKQEEYLTKFPLLTKQTGLIAIIDNEVKGIEIFNSPEIYSEYHEKIIKSYVIDSFDGKNSKNTINIKEVEEILNSISESVFMKENNVGLGESIKFSNNYGSGSALIYDDEVVHMPYFKNL